MGICSSPSTLLRFLLRFFSFDPAYKCDLSVLEAEIILQELHEIIVNIEPIYRMIPISIH